MRRGAKTLGPEVTYGAAAGEEVVTEKEERNRLGE